jgi:hypothetical protein
LKTTYDNGRVWLVYTRLYKVIALPKSQIQASTTLLTFESNMSIIQLPMLDLVNLERGEDDAFLLSNLDNDIVPTLDLVNMSPFLLR